MSSGHGAKNRVEAPLTSRPLLTCFSRIGGEYRRRSGW